MAALGVHVELQQPRDEARGVRGEGQPHLLEDPGALQVEAVEGEAVCGDVARGAHGGVVLGLGAVAESRGVADGEEGVERGGRAVVRLEDAGEGELAGGGALGGADGDAGDGVVAADGEAVHEGCSGGAEAQEVGCLVEVGVSVVGEGVVIDGNIFLLVAETLSLLDDVQESKVLGEWIGKFELGLSAARRASHKQRRGV